MDRIEMQRIFQMFDRNGDGRITKKELSDSLGNLGMSISDEDLVQAIDDIDGDGDGFIDMEDFQVLYQCIVHERDEEEDMREAFHVFDRNGDGFITADELRFVLSSLGLQQGRTTEACKQMIERVDVDGDGRVDFSEFKKMMKSNVVGRIGSRSTS